MKKYMFFIALFLAVSVFAVEKSSNISLNEGWVVWYERGWSEEPIIFHFENVSGNTAFKIMAVVYCYDKSGKLIGRYVLQEPGPIHKYFIRQGIFPPKTHTITAEVFNTWEYNP